MKDNSLNSRIPAYKKALANQGIQATYQDLVTMVQKLRTQFAQTYEGKFTVAKVMHGYIDFTYFYLQNDYLKNQKLKLGVVLNHQQAHFELWLLGQTKNVQTDYWQKLRTSMWVNGEQMPEYSIFETVLLKNHNFDDFEQIAKSICDSFDSISNEIFTTLQSLK